MKHYLLTIGIIAACFAFVSCTPSYQFKVDAIKGGQMNPGSSFVLVSGDENMPENDLRFKEAAKYVQTALEGKGYRKANSIAEANMLVEIAFEVGDPREITEIYNSPQTHWRPGFYHSIRLPVYSKKGTIVSWESRVVREPPRSYTYWEEQLEIATVYEKYLHLEAYDTGSTVSGSEAQQLWGITISNIDQSNDIRAYLPYMIAAAIPYIGEDTGSQIYVSVRSDDPTAQFILYPDGIPSSSQ